MYVQVLYEHLLFYMQTASHISHVEVMQFNAAATSHRSSSVMKLGFMLLSFQMKACHMVLYTGRAFTDAALSQTFLLRKQNSSHVLSHTYTPMEIRQETTSSGVTQVTFI